MPPCIALCMPVGREIHPLNFRSYRFLKREFLGPKGWYHLSVEGFPVEVARNTLTAQALAIPEVTHLLWVDADMVYSPDALQKLLAHDLDFVGGLCHDRRHPYKPVLARVVDVKAFAVDASSYGWLFDYPRGELVDVDATGGAFLLIRREVFEKVRERECLHPDDPGRKDPAALAAARERYREWWNTDEVDGLSEDLAFCRRACEAGFRIKVDTSLDIGHIGEVVIDSAFAQRNRQFEHSQWSPPGDILKLADEKPIATVVVTAYNPRPEFLLAAVRSALGQSVPVEVIVVDDGSKIPVQNILDASGWDGAPNLQVIRHEVNSGVAAALNTGIAAMTTRWFCWLPCDDLFEPRKVEIQLGSLLATGRLCSYTGFNQKIDNQNRIGHVGTILWASMDEQHFFLAQGCAINGSTVMIHKDVLDKVGPFDTSYRYAQDWEMWLRIDRAGYFWHGMPDKLSSRREFGNLTQKLNTARPDDPERNRRDMEDNRVSRMYSTRLCSCCGEVVK